ncbi:unannotated protein [freshwater metagenome]|uniref:Unannotated protein n=1 Tax=freshwater metagenome TaxID=449393 RepID=A0A6J5Z4M9_9ZZZZ
MRLTNVASPQVWQPARHERIACMIDWPVAQPTLMHRDLILRPWLPKDMDAVFDICQDPAIQEYTTVPVPYLREHARAFMESRLDTEQRDHYSFAGVIDGRVVASISLHGIRTFDHIAELGYWVAPQARGNHVASRGATLITDFAFTIGFRRICALTLPENQASQRTLLAAGFELEGIQRQAMTRRDGTQTDSVLFAKFPPTSVVAD